MKSQGIYKCSRIYPLRTMSVSECMYECIKLNGNQSKSCYLVLPFHAASRLKIQIKRNGLTYLYCNGCSTWSEQVSCCGFRLCLVLQKNRYRVQQLWKAKSLLSTNNSLSLSLSLSSKCHTSPHGDTVPR